MKTVIYKDTDVHAILKERNPDYRGRFDGSEIIINFSESEIKDKNIDELAKSLIYQVFPLNHSDHSWIIDSKLYLTTKAVPSITNSVIEDGIINGKVTIEDAVIERSEVCGRTKIFNDAHIINVKIPYGNVKIQGQVRNSILGGKIDIRSKAVVDDVNMFDDVLVYSKAYIRVFENDHFTINGSVKLKGEVLFDGLDRTLNKYIGHGETIQERSVCNYGGLGGASLNYQAFKDNINIKKQTIEIAKRIIDDYNYAQPYNTILATRLNFLGAKMTDSNGSFRGEITKPYERHNGMPKYTFLQMDVTDKITYYNAYRVLADYKNSMVSDYFEHLFVYVDSETNTATLAPCFKPVLIHWNGSGDFFESLKNQYDDDN